MRNVTLILDNGTKFHGKSFGYDKPVAGEVVFTTGMTGYPESLTDPSYAGQLMVMTYPLVGNYGLPPHTIGPDALPLYAESDRIHASALIVSDYSEAYSHWNAVETLGECLRREQVVGITDVDTRELTKVLREEGVMQGRIVFDDEPDNIPEAQYAGVNFAAGVSCTEVVHYNAGEGRKRVVIPDLGVKASIIRYLVSLGVEVVRVPWDYDFNTLDFDALFLANGPGDPDTCEVTVEHIRRFLADGSNRVCMGVGMGNQLLAKAAGAKVYKLKYGHRGSNQPVRRINGERCYVTAQNHGYAVDASTLPEGWTEMFVNLNDGTNEGICHTEKPWFAVQFIPDTINGCADSVTLYDHFAELLNLTK